jgi:hypothetical protein
MPVSGCPRKNSANAFDLSREPTFEVASSRMTVTPSSDEIMSFVVRVTIQRFPGG